MLVSEVKNVVKSMKLGLTGRDIEIGVIGFNTSLQFHPFAPAFLRGGGHGSGRGCDDRGLAARV